MYYNSTVMNDPIWNQLPAGLTFWEIANADPVWNQGAPLLKQPDKFTIVIDEVDTESIVNKKPDVRAGMNERLKKNVLQQLLISVDDSFSLYSPKFMINMENATKEHIRDFITYGAGSKLLGPKRAREIMSYLMSPMVYFNLSFIELWSFLLQRTIECEGKLIRWNVVSEENLTDTLSIKTKN